MVKIGADPTFKTPVGAEMGQKRRRDSPVGAGQALPEAPGASSLLYFEQTTRKIGHFCK